MTAFVLAYRGDILLNVLLEVDDIAIKNSQTVRPETVIENGEQTLLEVHSF